MTQLQTDDLYQRLPAKPLLMKEVVVIPYKDGVLVDGLGRLVALGDTHTKDHFTKLLTFLNGTRTLKELSVDLPDLPARHIIEAITTLSDLGLVEDGMSISDTATVSFPDTLAFLRRFSKYSRSGRDGLDLYRVMEQFRILIVGLAKNSAEASFLASLVAASGLHVELVSYGGLTASTARDNQFSTVAIGLCFTEEESRSIYLLEEWADANSIPWLRFVMNDNAGWVDLGPFFETNGPCCLKCFEAVHCSAPAAASHLTDTSSFPCRAYWLSMVALEVIYWICDFTPRLTGKGGRRYRGQGGQAASLGLSALPGCIRCRRRSGHISSQQTLSECPQYSYTAKLFEDYVAFLKSEPHHWRSDAHLGRDLLFIDQAQGTMNCEQLTLSTDYSSRARNESASGISLKALEQLLLFTAGMRECSELNVGVRRWAPTAGNLGSVEVCAVVNNISGLQPGAYFYQPARHSLARFALRSGELQAADLITQIIGRLPGYNPEVLLVMYGSLQRLYRKYGAFAYRLLQLDAGVALAQLQMVATELGIRADPLPFWSSASARENLKLDRVAEPITSVIALSISATHEKKQLHSLPVCLYPTPSVGLHMADDFSCAELEEVLDLLIKESEDRAPFLNGHPSDCEPTFTGPATYLPINRVVDLAASDYLIARRSARNFSSKAVGVQQLGTILASVGVSFGDLSVRQDLDSRTLTCLIYAPGVLELDRTLYCYDSLHHALTSSGVVPTLRQIEQLFVQKELAHAPVIMVITGALEQMIMRFGSPGHSNLLRQAGKLGHQLTTAASCIGLRSCIVAGIVPVFSVGTVKVDGWISTGLVAVIAGYEEVADER
jgi:SagB-type dehydrogenase family enzyme